MMYDELVKQLRYCAETAICIVEMKQVGTIQQATGSSLIC